MGLKLRIHLENLEPQEHALLSTYIQVISDPALTSQRAAVLDGRAALVVEGDDVVWINPCELTPADPSATGMEVAP